jgi:hypothetical protein
MEKESVDLEKVQGKTLHHQEGPVPFSDGLRRCCVDWGVRL